MKNLALITFLCLALAGLSAALNLNVAAANSSEYGNADPRPTPGAVHAGSQGTAAEALVAALYKAGDGKNSPFFQTKSRVLVDKYFTKSLGDLIWNDEVSSAKAKGVGVIEADPLYDAQDEDIKKLAIGHAEVKGNAAIVPVTFTNFGKKQTIKYHLTLVKSAWKIYDIEYGGDSGSMREWFKNSAEAEKPGTFEGHYKVGTTTCTITPSKMSYELRWVKGRGVEMLFSKDNNTFESEPMKKGGVDRFVFNDSNYNSGTFYSADGKTFPVKRIG
ncbi:MAG: hypothetical protein ACJ73D_07565 [Pyrinomonadaceae bacterium]